MVGQDTEREHALTGLPPWVRAIATLVFQHGVAGAIALFVVWALTQRFISDQQQIAADVRAHAVVTSSMSSAFVSFSASHAQDTQELIRLTREVCLNLARNEAARRACNR